MNETIQIYLLEALRLYLKNCDEKDIPIDEDIRKYFKERIKELCL